MTASHTTTAAPAWRAAIIGIVAALAVGIGVVFGTVMLQSRAAPIGTGASYVPASAPLYVEVRLEPSEAQDAALRELLGRFPEIEGIDLAQPLYGQLIAKIDETLAAEGTDLSWSADVDPWFDGRVGVAVLDIPAEAMRPEAPDPSMVGVPSTVFLLGVTDRTSAEASIERIIAASEVDVTLTEQEHDGVTIHADSDSGMAYALTDDQLILATTADDIVASLDAHASSSTTLSEAGSIGELTGALPDDWLVFGFYDFTDLLTAALEEGPAAASPGADAMRDLLANQSLRGAMALTVGGDRISLPMVSDPPAGAFAVTNAARDLADEVPGDALYYTEGGNVGASLSGLIASLKETFATMPDGAGQLDMVEAALGGDIEEMVSWIGDVATSAGYDGEQPWAGVIVVPNDMEQARRTMDQLSTFAGLATLDPSIGITIEERDVEGVEVTSLRWSDPNASEVPDPAMPVPFAPPEVVVEWTVTDDRVLIGVGDRFVERVLGLELSDSLAATPRYTDAVAEVGEPSNAGVTWLDIRGLRVALEAAFGGMDPAGLESYQAEILPWLEPIDRLVSVTSIEGDLLQSESVLFVE